MGSMLDAALLEGMTEITPLEDGREVKVRITSVGEVEESIRNGKTSRRIRIGMEVPEEPSAPAIFHTLWLPTEDSTPKQRNQTQNALAAFLKVFGLSLPIEDTDQMIGSTAWVIVKQEEYDGVIHNRIKKFVGPAQVR